MSDASVWWERLVRGWCWILTELSYRMRLGSLGSLCDLSIRRLKGGGRVFVGDRVTILWGARIEAVRSYSGKNYEPTIRIGDGVTIGQHFHCTSTESVTIGSRTAITANVTIIDSNHMYQDLSGPIKDAPIEGHPVSIGEDCIVLNNAVITAGTTIGRHSVVGANSVVSGVFPDYSVIMGNPARLIRKFDRQTQKWVP